MISLSNPLAVLNNLRASQASSKGSPPMQTLPLLLSNPNSKHRRLNSLQDSSHARCLVGNHKDNKISKNHLKSKLLRLNRNNNRSHKSKSKGRCSSQSLRGLTVINKLRALFWQRVSMSKKTSKCTLGPRSVSFLLNRERRFRLMLKSSKFSRETLSLNISLIL